MKTTVQQQHATEAATEAATATAMTGNDCSKAVGVVYTIGRVRSRQKQLQRSWQKIEEEEAAAHVRTSR